jgi:hypothetical protein
MGLTRKVGNGMPDRVEWERWRGRGQRGWRNRAAKGIGEWCSGARTRSEGGGRAVGGGRNWGRLLPGLVR